MDRLLHFDFPFCRAFDLNHHKHVTRTAAESSANLFEVLKFDTSRLSSGQLAQVALRDTRLPRKPVARSTSQHFVQTSAQHVRMLSRYGTSRYRVQLSVILPYGIATYRTRRFFGGELKKPHCPAALVGGSISGGCDIADTGTDEV